MGFFGNEHGRFGGQSHDGVLELVFRSSWAIYPGGDHHEGSCDDRHDHNSKEFLADAVRSLTVKFLDLEHDFLSPVVIFNSPAPKVELDDLLSWKVAFVEHIGQQDGYFPFGADQPDHAELDAPGFLPLPGTEAREVVIGRGEYNMVFLPAAVNEGLHRREGRLCRAPEEKIAGVVLSQASNEIKARVSPIEEKNALGRNKR